jgi:hypothetical protein
MLRRVIPLSRHTLLKSLMSGWTAQRMKMGQTVREPVGLQGDTASRLSVFQFLNAGEVAAGL